MKLTFYTFNMFFCSNYFHAVSFITKVTQL